MTGNRKKGTKKQRKGQTKKGVVRVGTPTQTSKGLEDRERGRQEWAGKQDTKGEKGKKGESAGQGGTLRNDQTGSRIETEKPRTESRTEGRPEETRAREQDSGGKRGTGAVG